jgi:3-hydroxyisobutyrate dehydrogenase
MGNLGFVGLGVMGAPMAAHLVEAGYKVAVWNRTAAKADPLKVLGARIAATPAEVALGAEVVFICVGDTPDVEQVLFGPQGVAEGIAPGSLVIDCTTISPEAEEDFARRMKAKGAGYLDAPLTGGQKGAIDGTLTFMVGGEAGDINRATPYFQAMGKKIVHAGPSGYGQRLKAVNQLVCGIHLLALGEGLAFAKKLGLDLASAREVLISGAARSWALEVYGEKILRDDFTPGFALKWQAKDTRIALEAATRLGLDLPGLKLADQRLRDAIAKGMGDEGSHSVYKLYGQE